MTLVRLFILARFISINIACPFSGFDLADYLNKPLGLRNIVLLQTNNVSSKGEPFSRFVKELSQRNLIIQTYSMTKSSDIVRRNSVIACPNSFKELQYLVDTIIAQNLAVIKPLVIFVNESLENAAEPLEKLKINQEVYLINVNDKSLREVYSINGVVVNRFLGRYVRSDPVITGEKTIEFLPSSNFGKGASLTSFDERRGNFYGQHLVTMTDKVKPFVILDPDFKELAPFSASRDAYNVTDYARGMYIEYLKTLATSLNFTYTLWRRKDGRHANSSSKQTEDFTFILLFQVGLGKNQQHFHSDRNAQKPYRGEC